jgi:hypothetical protein
MKKVKLTLTKDILKKDYKWLSRDFKSGEQVYLYTGSTYGCISKNGLACKLDGGDSFFELPTTVLALKHEEKEFGIFMTEQSMGYQLFYCKEFPMDTMELLTKIQSTIESAEEKPMTKEQRKENEVLKVRVEYKQVTYKIKQLQSITKLF